MNVSRNDLGRVLNMLPAMKNPTVSSLSDGAWVAVEVIVDKAKSKLLIPQLKKLGAQGIAEYPLNLVIE
jgi:ATP phosphoribosyltransferase